MREVRLKERKMKWPLMSNRSSPQQFQQTTRQNEKSPPTPGGETPQQHLNHPRARTSAVLNTTSPDSHHPIPNQRNILLILTLIGLIFFFTAPELDVFNNEIIDVNSEFKLQKMVLNNDCGVSSSPTNNTIGVTYTSLFYFSPTGVGLAEFNNLGCEFNAVLAATATVTIVTNENKNQNIFESGALWRHNNNKNDNNSKDNKNKNVSKTKEQLMSDEERSIMYREYHNILHFSLACLLTKYIKNCSESHFNLANMLEESQYKHFENAKYHFEKAVELEPFYATYRMFYAEFLWHDINHSDSEIHYKELLAFPKDNEDIYFNYELLLRDHLAECELAIEQFETALKLVPNDNEAEEELESIKNLLKDEKAKLINEDKLRRLKMYFFIFNLAYCVFVVCFCLLF